jgi:hypothetical protein
MRLYRFEQIERIPDGASSLNRVDEVTLSTSLRSGGRDHDHIMEVQAELVAPSEQRHSIHEGSGPADAAVRNVYTYVPQEPLTPPTAGTISVTDKSYLTSAWIRTAGPLQFHDRSHTGLFIDISV